MAAIALHSLAFLFGFTLITQQVLLRAEHAFGFWVIMKISRAVAFGLFASAFLRMDQHVQIADCGLGDLSTAAITAIGYRSEHGGCSGVVLRLFDHPDQLRAIHFLY